MELGCSNRTIGKGLLQAIYLQITNDVVALKSRRVLNLMLRLVLGK